MFGGDAEEDGGMFNQPTQGSTGTANPRNNAPVVSNGLFGGNDLKDDDPVPKKGGSKLNSIFDYEDDDNEEQTVVVP